MRSWWPVIAVVVLQLGALAFMPLRSASAIASGREITLATEAVDPFDPLAGRYVVLRYGVERSERREAFGIGDTVWIAVERSEPAWRGLRVTSSPERTLATRVSLRATWNGTRAVLENAGRLYLPEDECLAADELLRADPNAGLVDLAVDEHGNVSPLRLRIGERVFGS